jgi:hypothetical protein
MTGIAEIRARINRGEQWQEDAADLLKYIDSGQQASEFAAHLMSRANGPAMKEWVKFYANQFIEHLKKR